jgi:hypothetical protein
MSRREQFRLFCLLENRPGPSPRASLLMMLRGIAASGTVALSKKPPLSYDQAETLIR